jgi:DNA-binding response OmpR family regulator
VADLLLVDNDLRLTELLAWFLRKHGHDVRTAPSYADARARIAEREPELMLADLELGRERGREELERMERDGNLPRTLVVSGYLDAETETWLASRARIVGALRKPFELDELEDSIRRATHSAATSVLVNHASSEAAPHASDLSVAHDGAARDAMDLTARDVPPRDASGLATRDARGRASSVASDGAAPIANDLAAGVAIDSIAARADDSDAAVRARTQDRS